MKISKILFGLFLLAGAVAVIGYAKFSNHEAHSHEEAHAGHGTESSEEFERGPHRGRMLRQGDLAVEITIFETGVPPEYHVYAYKNDKPLAPQDIKLSIKLSRLDGEINTFSFVPSEDYLRGDAVVTEPHSFDVTVSANYAGKDYDWTFSSYEGRTQIDADAAKASGIVTEKAGLALIRDDITLSGQIVLNADTTANVRARFPGIVRDVKKGLGEIVKTGDILATVESNDSLQVYQVKAPIDGQILSRDTNIGDVAGEAPLFKIADLSTMWAELHVFPGDMARIQPGQKVMISALGGTLTAEGEIASLLPLAENATQTIVARLPINNAASAWRAGMTVQGKVTVDTREVALAVKSSGLQRFRDFTVVFAQVGDVYEVRMLDLGRDDGTHVEVLSGIKPGTTYVSGNSFLIRADIEKSGASHDH